MKVPTDFIETPPGPKYCRWSKDPDCDSVVWETECGRTWEFFDGGPDENAFDYCMSCGGLVIVGKELPKPTKTIEERVAFLEKVIFNLQEVSNGELVIYDDDDTTPIITFKVTDKDGNEVDA